MGQVGFARIGVGAQAVFPGARRGGLASVLSGGDADGQALASRPGGRTVPPAAADEAPQLAVPGLRQTEQPRRSTSRPPAKNWLAVDFRNPGRAWWAARPWGPSSPRKPCRIEQVREPGFHGRAGRLSAGAAGRFGAEGRHRQDGGSFGSCRQHRPAQTKIAPRVSWSDPYPRCGDARGHAKGTSAT